MLPHWQYLAKHQAARVERTLQAHLLGGAPFRVPGMRLGFDGSELAAAINGRSSYVGWVPRAAFARNGTRPSVKAAQKL